MASRRFNWIVLLVSGVLFVGIGALEAGSGKPTAVGWFAFGGALLVGSVLLKRMRLL